MGWVDSQAHFALREADKVVLLAFGRVVSLAVGKVVSPVPGRVASRLVDNRLDSDLIDHLPERPPDLEYLKSASRRTTAAVRV